MNTYALKQGLSQDVRCKLVVEETDMHVYTNIRIQIITHSCKILKQAFGDNNNAVRAAFPKLMEHTALCICASSDAFSLSFQICRYVRLTYKLYFFSQRIIFFSYNKSVNSIFNHGLSVKRTGQRCHYSSKQVTPDRPSALLILLHTLIQLLHDSIDLQRTPYQLPGNNSSTTCAFLAVK